MTNLEKYKNAFVESFDLDVKEVENASQETVEIWDSIGMMSLIAKLKILLIWSYSQMIS